ncbi:DUF943 family protein [Siccibacter turicensis]|uniref:DUF943 family protein n=1 Tax=Siccibacter turicensis TaxID=357233 RepID=UPI0004645F16|nr:DUF943 family protein [Siccibacter turicensis]
MNKRLIAGVIAAASCGYLLWQYFTPVEVVAVHDGNTILVRHFPYLKSRQIAWWEENKDMIQAKYGIPEGYDSYYYIYLMDFGNGYRTEPNESLLFWTDEVFCFNDIKTDARCIDRKPLFTVRWSKNNGLEYESY